MFSKSLHVYAYLQNFHKNVTFYSSRFEFLHEILGSVAGFFQSQSMAHDLIEEYNLGIVDIFREFVHIPFTRIV